MGGDGAIRVRLDPGSGSAPDLKPTHPANPVLPAAWNDCFPSYENFLAYAVPQDRALVTQPWYDRVVRQEISLGIPLSACEPLQGAVQSQAAENYVGQTEAVFFLVPQVAFLFSEERFDSQKKETGSPCRYSPGTQLIPRNLSIRFGLVRDFFSFSRRTFEPLLGLVAIRFLGGVSTCSSICRSFSRQEAIFLG